jgi:hypothetical protein
MNDRSRLGSGLTTAVWYTDCFQLFSLALEALNNAAPGAASPLLSFFTSVLGCQLLSGAPDSSVVATVVRFTATLLFLLFTVSLTVVAGVHSRNGTISPYLLVAALRRLSFLSSTLLLLPIVITCSRLILVLKNDAVIVLAAMRVAAQFTEDHSTTTTYWTDLAILCAEMCGVAAVGVSAVVFALIFEDLLSVPSMTTPVSVRRNTSRADRVSILTKAAAGILVPLWSPSWSLYTQRVWFVALATAGSAAAILAYLPYLRKDSNVHRFAILTATTSLIVAVSVRLDVTLGLGACLCLLSFLASPYAVSVRFSQLSPACEWIRRRALGAPFSPSDPPPITGLSDHSVAMAIRPALSYVLQKTISIQSARLRQPLVLPGAPLVVGSYRLVPPSFYKAALRYRHRPRPPRFALIPAIFHWELGNKLYVQLSPHGWTEDVMVPAAFSEPGGPSCTAPTPNSRQDEARAALRLAQMAAGLSVSKLTAMKRASILRAIQSEAGIVAGVNAQISFIQHTLAVSPHSEGSLRSLAAYAQSHRPALIPECLRLLANTRHALGFRAPLTLRYWEASMRVDSPASLTTEARGGGGNTGADDGTTASTQAVVARLAKRRHLRLARQAHADAVVSLRLVFSAIAEAQAADVAITRRIERSLLVEAGNAFSAIEDADTHFESLLGNATATILRAYAAYVLAVHLQPELATYYTVLADELESTGMARVVQSRLDPGVTKAVHAMRQTNANFERVLANSVADADDEEDNPTFASIEDESELANAFSFSDDCDELSSIDEADTVFSDVEVGLMEQTVEDLQAHSDARAHRKMNLTLTAIFVAIFVAIGFLHFYFIVLSLDTFSAGTFGHTTKDIYALLSSLHASTGRLLLLGSAAPLRHVAAGLRQATLGVRTALRVDQGAAFTNSTVVVAYQSLYGVTDPALIPEYPVPELHSSWLPETQLLRAAFFETPSVDLLMVQPGASALTSDTSTVYDALLGLATDAAMLGACAASVSAFATATDTPPLTLLLASPLSPDAAAAAAEVSSTCTDKRALAEMTSSVLANSAPTSSLAGALRDLIAECVGRSVRSTDEHTLPSFLRFAAIIFFPASLGILCLRALLFKDLLRFYLVALDGIKFVVSAPSSLVRDLGFGGDADDLTNGQLIEARRERRRRTGRSRSTSASPSAISREFSHSTFGAELVDGDASALEEITAIRDRPFQQALTHGFWLASAVVFAIILPSVIFSFTSRQYYDTLLSVLGVTGAIDEAVATAEGAVWSLSSVAASASGVPPLPLSDADSLNFAFDPAALIGDDFPDLLALLASTAVDLPALSNILVQSVVKSPELLKLPLVRFMAGSLSPHRAALGLASVHPPQAYAFTAQQSPRTVLGFFAQAAAELASSATACSQAGGGILDPGCAVQFSQTVAHPASVEYRHPSAAFATEALEAPFLLDRHPALSLLLETGVDAAAVCSELSTPIVAEINTAMSGFYYVLAAEEGVAAVIVFLLIRLVMFRTVQTAISVQSRAVLLLQLLIRRNGQLAQRLRNGPSGRKTKGHVARGNEVPTACNSVADPASSSF